MVCQQHGNLNAMTDENIAPELDQLPFDLNAPSPPEKTPMENISCDSPSNNIPVISSGSTSPPLNFRHLEGNATVAANYLVSGRLQEQEADPWLAADASCVSQHGEDMSGNAPLVAAEDQTARRLASVLSTKTDVEDVKPAHLRGRCYSLLASCSRSS